MSDATERANAFFQRYVQAFLGSEAISRHCSNPDANPQPYYNASYRKAQTAHMLHAAPSKDP